MPALRRTLTMLAAALALGATTAVPASAVVGGRDAQQGELPAVAYVELGGLFGCTGTVIAPTWVLTAGHCGSLTGVGVSSPISWPAPLITVRANSITAHRGDGETLPVKAAYIPSQYLGFENGYDITLIELRNPTSIPPVKIAGPAQAPLWAAGVLQTIAGFGVTAEGGDAPDVLQVAQVPAIGDAQCAERVDTFDPLTMVCAGFPQGGIDTCQGDSGGPMLGTTSGGALRVTGATSYGDGCARPDSPGVYARVGDAELRSFIAGYAPEAIDTSTATTSAKRGGGGKKRRAKRSTCKAARRGTKAQRAKARKRCAARTTRRA